MTAPEMASTMFYGGGMGLGLAMGLQFMKWMLTFAASRQDKQQEHIDARTQALLDNLSKRLDTVSDKLAAVERDLAECNRRHLESDAEVNRLRAQLEQYVKKGDGA